MARTPTPLTAPACTSFNSLANSTTAVASTASVTVGTSTNVADHLVQVSFAGPATATASATTQINLYVYGSINGTIWPGQSSGSTNELIDGTDKAITWSSNGNNALPLGIAKATTTTSGTGITYTSEPLSVAAAFGGTMPAKYVIVAQNQSGAALASSGHSIAVTEISYS